MSENEKGFGMPNSELPIGILKDCEFLGNDPTEPAMLPGEESFIHAGFYIKPHPMPTERDNEKRIWKKFRKKV